jgi:hypothetical protein
MEYPLRSASGSGKPTELAFCHAKSNERKNKKASFAVWEIHPVMRLTVVLEVASRMSARSQGILWVKLLATMSHFGVRTSLKNFQRHAEPFRCRGALAECAYLNRSLLH